MTLGTQGYAEKAKELVDRYKSVAFPDKYPGLLQLLPPSPSRVLDIGAGTGADAAWFALRGDSVVAVEPTDELRRAGSELHSSLPIEWLSDSLPDLALLAGRVQGFDLLTLTAVWMHLDQPERELAMPRLVSLMRPGALLFMSLRHGPVPHGRRMFEVSLEETVALAEACGLQCVAAVADQPSAQPANRNAGVTWSLIVLEHPVFELPAQNPAAFG